MTNNKISNSALIICTILLLCACSNSTPTTIHGTIDYLGDADFYLEFKPLHYKYSEKNQIPIEIEGTTFRTILELDEPQIVYLGIQDEKYPIFITPGEELTLEILRADFPENVVVEGTGKEANQAYQQFLAATNGLESEIKAEMDKFKVGEQNTALELSSKKVELAETHLKDTDFNDLYLKTLGEDLVIRLRAIEYSGRHFPDFDEDGARAELFEYAKSIQFFTLPVLEAQRAGIRDFTHYFSRTFGIYDSVNQAYGTTLAEYDIKQVAYKELNAKRMQVIEHIENEDARAYAELFLVAERIGEIPLDNATPSYQKYLNDYADYTEYTSFITWFYEEIKSVSPGQPAVPFSLPDRNGTFYTMNNFAGKYVLLDFWAGWCQPCLEEFSHMNEIYDTYSRDQLEIVGISTEVDSLVWIYDIERFDNPWPQLYGGKGFDQETFKGYKGGGIPFYILIDPSGNIVRYNDMRPSFNFTEVLDSLLIHHQPPN
ncbi:MAG: TlpA family protein disulfide reductase [Balneolaceae bacterium]|nr:TlpA family protein disulfide reductase [Balneolaceae bacterium]